MIKYFLLKSIKNLYYSITLTMSASSITVERLWINANVATMAGTAPYGRILCRCSRIGDRIVWVGPQCQLPQSAFRNKPEIYDLKGQWITPGLIDCHTHLVYSGVPGQRI